MSEITVTSELARVLTEHGRADHKAEVAVGFSTVAVTVLAGTAHGPLALAAGCAWALTAVLAGAVLYPRLGGDFGFVAYAASRDDHETQDTVARAGATATVALRLMSRLAMRKYRLTQASYLAGALSLALTALVLAGRP